MAEDNTPTNVVDDFKLSGTMGGNTTPTGVNIAYANVEDLEQFIQFDRKAEGNLEQINNIKKTILDKGYLYDTAYEGGVVFGVIVDEAGNVQIPEGNHRLQALIDVAKETGQEIYVPINPMLTSTGGGNKVQLTNSDNAYNSIKQLLTDMLEGNKNFNVERTISEKLGEPGTRIIGLDSYTYPGGAPGTSTTQSNIKKFFNSIGINAITYDELPDNSIYKTGVNTFTDTPTNVVDDGIDLYHSRSKGVDKPRDFHAGTYQAAIDRSAFMFGDTNMYQLIKNTQELAQEQVNDMLSEIVSDSTGKFEDGKYLEREILVDLPNGNQQPVNVLVETIDDTGGYKVMILDKDNFGFTIYSEDGFGEAPANKSLLEVNGNAVLVGEADDTFGYVAGFKPENKTFNYKDGYELYKVEIKPNANVVIFTDNIELVENGVKQNIDPDLFVNYLEMNLLTDIDSITLPDGKTIDLQGLNDTEKRNKLKNNIDVIGYRNQMEDVGSTSYYFLNNDSYKETLVDNATNNKFDNDVLKKFIDTNPNVGITDFKRASGERLNIVTDLLSSKPDTPTNVVDDVTPASVVDEAVEYVDNLNIDNAIKKEVKDKIVKVTGQASGAIPIPGVGQAIDLWETAVLIVGAAALAAGEIDELPKVVYNYGLDLYESILSGYNIPFQPAKRKEYNPNFERISSGLTWIDKLQPTSYVINPVIEEFQETEATTPTMEVPGFGTVPASEYYQPPVQSTPERDNINTIMTNLMTNISNAQGAYPRTRREIELFGRNPIQVVPQDTADKPEKVEYDSKEKQNLHDIYANMLKALSESLIR